MATVEDLHEGDLCEFTYVQQSGNGQWYRWTCRAVFVYRSDQYGEPRVGISFRPLAGTSHIDARHITSITVISSHEDRRGRGDGAAMLPKRQPGAVQAPAYAQS